MIQLDVKDISKCFGARKIFDGISFTLASGESLAVTGPNGSGKSTMIHILTGLGRATAGAVQYSDDSTRLSFEQYHDRMAVVAPYHELYESMTGLENLIFYTRLAGREVSGDERREALQTVGLAGRGNDQVAAYSSGMKQRLKYALAILRKPDILLIDEPSAYLDESGKKIVFEFLESMKTTALIVIATNEREEAGFADRVCQLGG